MWEWEILKNKEAPKKDAGQKAVDIITTANSDKVATVVEKKFPNPNKINEDIKKQNDEGNTLDIASLSDIEEQINQIKLENIRLMQESDKIVDNVLQTNLKNIVTFISYFNSTWPKMWFSLKIINSPLLEQNGRDDINIFSIRDTSLWQKKEIVKAFMSIPSSIVQTQIGQINNDKTNRILAIDEARLPSLLDNAKIYQNIQSQITQNDIEIRRKWEMQIAKADAPIKLADFKASQIIWELYELPITKQADISDQLQSIKNTYKENYTITWIKLLWYADKTPVTPEWKIKIEEYFTKHLNLLKEKWMDVSALPADYDHLGRRLVKNNKIDDKNVSNTDMVSNRWFAITRALMQISRMKPEQLSQLAKSKIELDLHTSDEFGDKETAWWIVFEGIWTRIWEKTPPQEFKMTNKSPEILLSSNISFAVKIWDQRRIFSFEKKDITNPDWTTKPYRRNNDMRYGKVAHNWIPWSDWPWLSYAPLFDKLNSITRKKQATAYDHAHWEALIWISIPDASTVPADVLEKFNTSKKDQTTDIPSAIDLLNLYSSVWWDQGEAEKLKALYAL